MLKKWIGCFAAMLLFSSAYAGEVSITEVATEIGQNHVRYPQLSGMESAQVQSAINDELVLHSGVTDHLLTLVTLGQNPWKIQVDYEASIVD